MKSLYLSGAMTKPWLLALLLLVFLGAVACKDSGDDGAGPTPDVWPTPGSPTVAVSPTPTPSPAPSSPTPDGSPATLAPGFPDDFPVYAGATLDSSEPAEGAVLARWKTPDPVSQVAEFYRQALAEDPWQILTIEDSPEANLIGIQVTRLDIPDISGAMAIRRVTSDGQDVTSIFVSITPLE